MRIFLLLLLFPAWASAQPAMIPPEQVIGFVRADLNEDGDDERFVLVLDSEGGVDLYIFNEQYGVDPIYIENFLETTRYPPEISLVSKEDISISLHSVDGLGNHKRDMLIQWDRENGGYVVVGLSIETEPRMADEPHFSCGIDFLVGGMRIVKGDAVEDREISVPPSPLLDPVPEASLALCYD